MKSFILSCVLACAASLTTTSELNAQCGSGSCQLPAAGQMVAGQPVRNLARGFNRVRPVRRVVAATARRQPVRSTVRAVAQRRPVRSVLRRVFSWRPFAAVRSQRSCQSCR